MSAAQFSERQREALARVWNEGIPLAKHMQVVPSRLDGDGLRLRVPLAPCRNHMGTAFAGALQASMTLAGWGLAAALLADEAAGDLVAQSATVRFLAPVREDFEVVARPPPAAAVAAFLERYRRRGRARIELAVEAAVGGVAHAAGEVRYAAIRHAGATSP